jgi:perosamine synthetase
MNPYARHLIDDADRAAVDAALRSGWLTCGPAIGRFEAAVARFTGTADGVAVNSGTAALHCAMHALGIGPGDEVIVPAMTFAATANAVLYQGGTPVFADVEPDTLLLDPGQVETLFSPRTKALITVDYAGQPSHYDALAKLCRERGAAFVADACHSLGGEDQGRRVGSLADLSVFSFHPAKHLACGEGGMVVGDDPGLMRRMRAFRNHGIDADPGTRAARRTYHYEMHELGFNYRITDIQCALGLSQLDKLPHFLDVRSKNAAVYDAIFERTARSGLVRPLARRPGVRHAFHLYVVRVDFAGAGIDRQAVYGRLLDAGVGVNVHYLPVYLHPYYLSRLGTTPGLCPRAEAAYQTILSLPMHAAMGEAEAGYAAQTLMKILGAK